MCGACGRTTVADPALGPVRTMRQHLIVAGTINAVCTGLPGAPKVTALSDGWMMTGPSGVSRQCQTLEQLWSAVLGCFTAASVLDRLRQRRHAYAADPANAGLPALAAGVVPDPAYPITATNFQGEVHD
ncbi:hypothetical protein [Arthrobacter sp. Soil762]|uniref:hypothetical protein n=1 Tax=Arthrobacter sp. Soil762 TaxID=1736401 RepID=UPI0006F50F96|nr:hypothetical protein [Arthrobacter sp. Soil762]KRE71661.1 hypothetical protein ASG77_11625 [Arthrobacter sp. Soil762]